MSGEKGDKFDKRVRLWTLIIACFGFLLSIANFFSSNLISYNQFKSNTKENISMELIISDVDFSYKANDDNTGSFLINCHAIITNNSNLPVTIHNVSISKTVKKEMGVSLEREPCQFDLPSIIEPQKSISLKTDIVVFTTEEIHGLLMDNYDDFTNISLNELNSYLNTVDKDLYDSKTKIRHRERYSYVAETNAPIYRIDAASTRGSLISKSFYLPGDYRYIFPVEKPDFFAVDQWLTSDIKEPANPTTKIIVFIVSLFVILTVYVLISIFRRKYIPYKILCRFRKK